MRIYLSGGITGVRNAKENFNNAEKEILQNCEGYTVVNPFRVNAELPTDLTHGEYMKMSFCMLDICDAIYMLQGWEKSKGACMEYGYAIAKGKSIYYETI